MGYQRRVHGSWTLDKSQAAPLVFVVNFFCLLMEYLLINMVCLGCSERNLFAILKMLTKPGTTITIGAIRCNVSIRLLHFEDEWRQSYHVCKMLVLILVILLVLLLHRVETFFPPVVCDLCSFFIS